MKRYLHRRLHRTSPASTTIAQTNISPLEIPEILDLIFSFLNDSTLRRSVLRVSRQWYLLSQTRLSREVVWFEHSRASKKERALCTLPGASKVHFSFHSITPAAFKAVRDALLHLEDEGESSGKQRHRRRPGSNALDCHTNSYINQPTSTSTQTVYGFTPLREMDLFVWYTHTDSLEWFPFPSSLVSLTIGFTYAHYTTIDLHVILEKCPALERLRIESHGTPVILSGPAPRLKMTTKDTSQLPPLSLRSLVLCGIGFAQEDLETLLLLTPNLKELQLRAMLWRYDRDNYEWARLFQLLKKRNITLDKAHFSMAGRKMTAEETEMLMTGVLRPSSQERSLWALDLTPQLLQSVFSLADTLTTLEILWKPTSKEYPRTCCERSLDNTHALIHKQLCESPRLVHLTTLKTIVRLQDIDLFGRAGYTDLDSRDEATVAENFQSSPSTSRPPPPAIWRCRGLRTLRIDFHIPQTTEVRPVYSRIVFGYVSRVCPLLEDLQIGTQETCHSWVGPIYYFRYYSGISMNLSGGLCLLGRLKFLQRLRVFSDVGVSKITYKDWDVNWISTSGRKSMLSNWRRRREVKSWREWRRNEDQVESIRTRIRMRLAISGASHPTPDADALILKQLENLGLLLDVEEMVKEMGVKGFRPMPALEELSFNHPTLMPPEYVFEHLFPSMLDKLRSR
ncbi:hypothetical protein F5H01DRAFT_329446 [Linnemannia elongata]|nr:hypothetical protein F5H01DRAFT_329446 [Linnemannia elongata]